MITFVTNRSVVTEGDVVEIRWECPNAQSVSLSIDNGFKNTQMELEMSGVKRFRLNRSKGKTKLILSAVVNGRTYKETQNVKVKPLKTVHAETVDQQGNPVGKGKQWMQRLVTKWQTYKRTFKYNWSLLPEKKQVAGKALGIMVLASVFSMIFPKLHSLGLMAVAIYLAVVFFRKR